MYLTNLLKKIWKKLEKMQSSQSYFNLFKKLFYI